MTSVTLSVDGMTCASCVRRVERALAAVPGVGSVSVNLATERATIDSAAPVDLAALTASVQRAGYAAQPFRDDVPLRDAFAGPPTWHVVLAFALATPLMLSMLVSMAGVAPAPPPAWQFGLATPVLFGLGARFFGAAWRAVRARAGNMDLLVVIGTTSAWLMSSWLAFFSHADGEHVYFDAAAGVVAFVLLGKWLEARVKRRTADALRALEALRPATARVRRDGAVVEQALSALRIDDVVLLSPGDRIAADGVVTVGSGHVDESLVTGESTPIWREPGDALIGGALNLDAALELRVAAVGAETRLSRIVRLVESAQAMKSPVQRLVDRVSAVFVPVVLAIAALTFAAWLFAGAELERAAIDAIAVLVIAARVRSVSRHPPRSWPAPARLRGAASSSATPTCSSAPLRSTSSRSTRPAPSPAGGRAWSRS